MNRWCNDQRVTHFGAYPGTSIFVWNLIYLESIVIFLHMVLLLHCTSSAGCVVALLSKPEDGLPVVDCRTNGSPGAACPLALVQHHSIVAWAPLPQSEGFWWTHAATASCPVLVAISIVSGTEKNIQKYKIQMCITLSTGEAWPTCSSNRCQSYMPTVRSSRAHIHFGSCNWRQCKGCRTREFEEGRSLRGNCSPGQLHASLPIHNPNNHLNRSNKIINYLSIIFVI